jgi:ATP-binding cassette subfamily B protein/subfamily B ATP-binding cassette protein MsbA
MADGKSNPRRTPVTRARARYRRVLGLARSEWRAIAAVLVMATLAAGLGALQPWPLKLLIDYGLADNNFVPGPLAAFFEAVGIAPGRAQIVIAAAVAVIGLFAAAAALESAVTLVWFAAGQRLVYAMASRMFMQLQKLSLLFHAKRTVGDALSRLTGDAWSVYVVAEAFLIAPVKHLLVVVFVGALAWQLDRTLTLLILATAPLLALSAFCFGGALKRTERMRREALSKLTSFVHQTIGAMPVVQAFGASARNAALFTGLSDNVIATTRRSTLVEQSYTIMNGVAITAGIALVVYAGGRAVLGGEMALGSLLVFIAYMRTLESASRNLLTSYGSLRAAEASVERVMEILDADDVVRDEPGARALPVREPGRSGHLVFEHVSFGYEPGRPVLRDVCLEIAPGETVALVGASGAGKTTLASLVPRFFDPGEGVVRLDGMDLRSVQLDSLRAEIALVLQDPFLLPASVLENIAYGRPGAARDDIVAAAVAANAHEFIRDLPDGYDTVLEERGANLSGGQRQRLAIARALLRDPRVLILDEPTSALDTVTERQVLEALRRLEAGRTTLVIAHRLAAARAADRVVVLGNGMIAESGTHTELIARGGVYARLHALSEIAGPEREP